MPTQTIKTKRTKPIRKRCRSRKHHMRPIAQTGGGLLPKFGADTIIKLTELPTVKAQFVNIPVLANEQGVTEVKNKYGKSTEELYDIITPADGSEVKVWSHGTGPEAARTVTAGIPGRHVYLTAGPTRPPEIIGIVDRTK